MIIVGIDPGTAATGYGVISTSGNAISHVDSGVISTTTSMPLPHRLLQIYDGIRDVLKKHSPKRVAIEEAFYGKNVHTTLVLGHARGVAMLAAAQYGCDVNEYSPREIKKAVTGNGNAEKDQVAYMVKVILGLQKVDSTGKGKGKIKIKQDMYDALAAAICDFHCAR